MKNVKMIVSGYVGMESLVIMIVTWWL